MGWGFCAALVGVLLRPLALCGRYNSATSCEGETTRRERPRKRKAQKRAGFPFLRSPPRAPPSLISFPALFCSLAVRVCCVCSFCDVSGEVCLVLIGFVWCLCGLSALLMVATLRAWCGETGFETAALSRTYKPSVNSKLPIYPLRSEIPPQAAHSLCIVHCELCIENRIKP